MGKEITDPIDAIITLFSIVLDELYIIAVPGAVIAGLYAAFLFITAGGSSERVSRGKRSLFYAVIGLAAVFILRAVMALLRAPAS